MRGKFLSLGKLFPSDRFLLFSILCISFWPTLYRLTIEACRISYEMYVTVSFRSGTIAAATGDGIAFQTRDSRYFSRDYRVSRDDALFFSHPCLHTLPCKHLAVSLCGDWYATGKVDTRDLRTLQTINICGRLRVLTIRFARARILPEIVILLLYYFVTHSVKNSRTSCHGITFCQVLKIYISLTESFKGNVLSM